MSPTFVVPDAHGNVALVALLLKQEGIVDDDFERVNRDVTVVQLGDLCNCVMMSIEDDRACLGFAPEWFDVYLVGNHEHPYFGGPAFGGFFSDFDIHRALLRLNDSGLIRAAHAADDVLLTHAGVGPWALRQLDDCLDTPGIAAELNAMWKHDPRDPVFSSIGASRGGWQEEGGILWADWSERKVHGPSQLVGHTVGDEIREAAGVTCIDLGCGKGRSRIAGAWIRNGAVSTVIFDRNEAAEEAA